MFSFKKAKTEVPTSIEVEELDSAQLWRVDWTSRHGPWSYSVQEESEIFLVEGDAKKFAESLRGAFKLVRHTAEGCSVKCYHYKKRGLH